MSPSKRPRHRRVSTAELDRVEKAAEYEHLKFRHSQRVRLLLKVQVAYPILRANPSVTNGVLARVLNCNVYEIPSVRHAFNVRVEKDVDFLVSRLRDGQSFSLEDIQRALAVDADTAKWLHEKTVHEMSVGHPSKKKK